MKHRFFFLAPLLATVAFAQSSGDAAWIGVWQGTLDGQPSVTLTLAKDTGELDGTIVLNIISREGGQPHVVAMEPHVLLHPHLVSDNLSFQLKRLNPTSDPMNFTVALTLDGKARIHCLNCGPDAPTVDLVKAQ
jgi:hypothetical protein